MQLNELVKAVMKTEKVTQTELAERVGKTQVNVSRILSRPSMSGETAVEMLKSMGYELVAVKKTYVGKSE